MGTMVGSVIKHDVIINGVGLAGLKAAIGCRDEGLEVAVVSKVHPLRSHPVTVQGGINAPLGNDRSQGEDPWRSHMFDTVKGSDFLADQDAVRTLCQTASSAVLEMDNFGTAFSRDEEGRIAQRPFGWWDPRGRAAATRTSIPVPELAVKNGLLSEEEARILFDHKRMVERH